MQQAQETLLRGGRSRLADAYTSVRQQTERLCEPLTAEDLVLQSMADASPVKWHLAHTTWFFETFVLAAASDFYQPFDSRFGFLFNSYYNALGDRLARPQRGLLSRPTAKEVFQYRAHVDEQISLLLRDDALSPCLASTLELGLHHEQQHQELILTDLKHAFSCNPLRPTYRRSSVTTPCRQEGAEKDTPLNWLPFPAGVRRIGHAGEDFAFDNETPRHRVFVEAFFLANRLATCREYQAFMEAGGYDQPQWWLSDGWSTRQTHDWTAPLYWEKHEGQWMQLTLDGIRPVRDEEPVCHLSFYEADAFARWSGARLPTEAEWEIAAEACPSDGSFLEADHLHPSAVYAPTQGTAAQMFGEAWQWTASPYIAYPGYTPLAGALGEYNGKFMCNQMVLRGGSCATPRSHFRLSYRNFFPPEARWQFTGVRLARNP
jgi:ergothioneine biosynthesis protein EgtB